MLNLVRRTRTRWLAAYTILAISLLITLSSSGVLYFEQMHPESNIRNFGDAIWWSFSTITTIGYGDHYPVSIGGRLITVLLMFAGISLFVTFTGLVSSSIMQMRNSSERRRELEILHRIKSLEEIVEKTERMLIRVKKDVEE